jgi:hypothetical protein
MLRVYYDIFMELETVLKSSCAVQADTWVPSVRAKNRTVY